MQSSLKIEEETLALEIDKWIGSESDKGQIYTRADVVEFMISLIGLNSAEDFASARILEPSCGEGEFVAALVERMLSVQEQQLPVAALKGRILAIDLLASSIEKAKSSVAQVLEKYNYAPSEVAQLLASWFQTDDFLLTDIQASFTHIIGNPPYLRVESVPKPLIAEYRRRYSTMTDRADIYVPFFQKSLSLLTSEGKLSFICADRWTKNTYGKALRRLISQDFSLDLFIDLYGVDAFESEVMTYPAITQISKNAAHSTLLRRGSAFTQEEAVSILSELKSLKEKKSQGTYLVDGEHPWLTADTAEVELIKKLEAKFETLEDTGCKVYIGAATGANKIFIVERPGVGPEVESSRVLPVITASEIKDGALNWAGKYLINTYDKDGVIDVENYPKLSAYLHKHKALLSARHVAKKDTKRWYKTIDRVYEERAKAKKLLIPDISDKPIVLYDEGQYHPNNSIYYICAETWDLRALRLVLLSAVTRLFISSYSTKIAKGYMRFQAQHLRRLRLPQWETIDSTLRQEMIQAEQRGEVERYTPLACAMYGLNKKETALVAKIDT